MILDSNEKRRFILWNISRSVVSPQKGKGNPYPAEDPIEQVASLRAWIRWQSTRFPSIPVAYLRLCILLIVGTAATGIAYSYFVNKGERAKQAAEASAILERFSENRRRLKSGHFVVTGQFSNAEGKCTLECLFSGSDWVINREYGNHHLKVLALGEESFTMIEGNDAAQLIDRSQAQWQAHWFDIRTVGFAFKLSLLDLKYNLEELIKLFQERHTGIRIERAAPSTVRLISVFPLADSVYEITFDRDKDMLPILSQSRHGNDKQVLKASWANINGAWVPRTIEELHNGKTVLHLRFAWKSVNTDVSQELTKDEQFHSGVIFLD